MTKINTTYKQRKVEQMCLCDIDNGEFFQFPGETCLYRRLEPRGPRCLVLNMETLEPETYDLSVVVNRVKVKDVVINVEFEAE